MADGIRVNKNIKDAYVTLGIDYLADHDDIKAAYMNLVKKWHPDLHMFCGKKKEKANHMLKEINAAYDLIEDAPLQKIALDSEESLLNDSDLNIKRRTWQKTGIYRAPYYKKWASRRHKYETVDEMIQHRLKFGERCRFFVGAVGGLICTLPLYMFQISGAPLVLASLLLPLIFGHMNRVLGRPNPKAH